MKHRTLCWILAADFPGGSLLAGCQEAGDKEGERDIGAPLLFFDSPTAIPNRYIVVFKDGIKKLNINAAIKRVVQLRTRAKLSAPIVSSTVLLPS
ncbi:MAG: hypothetical protein MJE77_09315 [Proteobacteria bacterium]|nr:hypothetical protein [Pseudomonadota bacterium]